MPSARPRFKNHFDDSVLKIGALNAKGDISEASVARGDFFEHLIAAESVSERFNNGAFSRTPGAYDAVEILIECEHRFTEKTVSARRPQPHTHDLGRCSSGEVVFEFDARFVKLQRVPYARKIQACNFHKGLLFRLGEIFNAVCIGPDNAWDSHRFTIPSCDGNVMLPVLRLHDLDRMDPAARYVTAIFLRDVSLVVDDILIGVDNEHTYRVLAQRTETSTMASTRIIHVGNYQHASLILDRSGVF